MNNLNWHSSRSDVSWPESALYNEINGSSFLTNTTYVPSGWETKIAITNWKYGDITSNGSYKGSIVYSTENGWTNTVSAKIGLMYIYDYLYAYAS